MGSPMLFIYSLSKGTDGHKLQRMESDIFLAILGGSFLFGICYWAKQKRKQVTRRCPKCGAICHANGASTGLRNAYGPVYNFKCNNCGNKFIL